MVTQVSTMVTMNTAPSQLWRMLSKSSTIWLRSTISEPRLWMLMQHTVPSRKRAHGWCTLHWAKIGGWANIRDSQYHVYTWKSAQVSFHASLNSRAAATIDFSLIQARLPIQSKGSGRGTSPCVIEWSPIKWAWLRLLAVYVRLFLLKLGINLARQLFSTLLLDLTKTIWSLVLINQPFELRFQGQLHMVP